MRNLKPIFATVDQGLLSKVDRIFDASPITIFNELLQNSRRAGATLVTVSVSKVGETVVVGYQDNGVGIADPAVLLALAKSGWEGKESEDPAGVGFFCLSTCESITVRSGDWKADLDPEVFKGLKPMIPVECEHQIQGTALSFSYPGVTAEKFAADLGRAAMYCGIEMVKLKSDGTVENEEWPAREWLGDVYEIHDFEEDGYSIGVVPHSARDVSVYRIRVIANFFGVQVAVPIEASKSLLSSLDMTPLLLRVDVKDTRDLQLVLPARNAIKHGSNLDKLIERCENAYFSFVQKERYGKHAFSFAIYRTAKERGYDIGPASPRLIQLPAIRYANSDRSGFEIDVSRRECVIAADTEFGYYHNLPSRWSSEMPLMVRSRPDYVGYGWYDAIPIIQKSTVYIDDDAYDYQELFDYGYEKLPGLKKGGLKVVNSLKISYLLSSGTVLVHEAKVLCCGEERDSWFEGAQNERSILLPKSETEGVMDDDIAELLAEEMFAASEDIDSDSYELQHAEFVNDADLFLRETLLGEDAALKHAIVTALQKVMDRNPILKDKTWKITWSPESRLSVEL